MESSIDIGRMAVEKHFVDSRLGVVKGRTAQTQDSRNRDMIVVVGSKPRENRWIRTSAWYRVSRVQRLKEIPFDYRSHIVPSIEGSCEHVAHPLGGDHVVDRWCNNKRLEKGGSG